MALQVLWQVMVLVGVLALAVLAVRLLGGRLLPGGRGQSLRLREHLALGREGGLGRRGRGGAPGAGGGGGAGGRGAAAGRSLLGGTGGRGVWLIADLTAAQSAEDAAAAVAPRPEPPTDPAAGFGGALEASLARLRRLGAGDADA